MMRWIAIAALVAGCGESRKEPIMPELPPRSISALPIMPALATPSARVPVVDVPVIVPGPAAVERFEVPGDRPASIVKSADGRPPRLVFLPGICQFSSYSWLVAITHRATKSAPMFMQQDPEKFFRLEC